MNRKKCKIIFLYSTIGHYMTSVLREIKNLNSNAEIVVVYWDKLGINSNKFEIKELNGTHFIPRSSLDSSQMAKLLIDHNPDILYISGWQDKGYVNALKRYRRLKRDTITVCGIDDQWHGYLRQHIGKIYFRLFYKKLYDFMWVAGKPQYHYAQRFGYGPERIVSNIYTADSKSFSTKSGIAKRFVFVGRFVSVKGLDVLFSAYERLSDEIKQEWPLILIGDGGLREQIVANKSKYVTIKPYMQIDDLKAELSNGGVACIPSRKDQWGLPIHEMAMLGYPLVVSSACGAATEFLISGYNGYLFRNGDVDSLFLALFNITQLNTQELELFSARSQKISNRIDSEFSASSLLSVLDLAKI
jgi:glycosyltransferase involved in cell wall biosynthesis